MSTYIDEYLTQVVFGKGEGEKVEGLQAAVIGAAAGLIAQAVTTPVSYTIQDNQFCRILHIILCIV
jgi:hypothetical protein